MERVPLVHATSWRDALRRGDEECRPGFHRKRLGGQSHREAAEEDIRGLRRGLDDMLLPTLDLTSS